MDPFYAPDESWSEKTREAWDLLVEATSPRASQSERASREAQVVAAGAAGADLSAQNELGLHLITLASRVMEKEALSRLIEQSAPASAKVREKAIKAAGRFLDMGETARTLRLAFAARERRHLEEAALAKAAGPAPKAGAPRRV